VVFPRHSRNALPCSRCTCRVSSPPSLVSSRPPSSSPNVWCGCWLEGFSAVWEARIHPKPPIFAHGRTPSKDHAGVTYIYIPRSHSLPPQPARPVSSAPTGVTFIMASSIASVVTKTVTKVVASSSASPSATLRATPQGGVLEGSNPSQYDPKNPIFLFIIQVRPDRREIP
jgi:hypothetical protein